MATDKYKMTISRLTVDKLGVKLYDRVSAVIAELVANSYDADATKVEITAPMGQYLASIQKGELKDLGHEIVVADNGFGMVPEVVNPFYLKVGGERRKDPKRGDKSPKYKRRVMGRKGVGKLAPFGICRTIEVISSGGKKVDGEDADGKPAKGYRTAHFIMHRDEIVSDEDVDYSPEVGSLDGKVLPKHGTKLILRDFVRRQVPDMKAFSRQIAQRFGIKSSNWQVLLIDSTKTSDSPEREQLVDAFSIPTMENTLVSLTGPETESVPLERQHEFHAKGPDGKELPTITAGFVHEDRFYPAIGWVAYARESYRDDLMAGVRIYCRGKIAAQTSVFNRKAGFTGEHSVRSYLVGEIDADWIDESEDLIQTDRRDILWSDDLGQAFEKWGQKIVQLVGTLSRDPMKRKIWDLFLEIGDVENRVTKAYPGSRWEPIRDRTMTLAKLMGERLRPDEVQDKDYVDSLVQLSLMLGPHVVLDNKLREAASEEEAPIGVLTSILRTARVAELSSFGLIAERRIRVIERIIDLKDDPDTLEQALQDSLTEAPWLINPQWSPITANQALVVLREEFEKFFEKQTGKPIYLTKIAEGKKRPDFVLTSQDPNLQILEIKRPSHKLTNNEWERIQLYIDVMSDFLAHPGDEEFKTLFSDFDVTLICDEIGLTGSQRKAFEAYKSEGRVEHITWKTFLLRTRKMHEAFLEEAERQRALAATE